MVWATARWQRTAHSPENPFGKIIVEISSNFVFFILPWIAAGHPVIDLIIFIISTFKLFAKWEARCAQKSARLSLQNKVGFDGSVYLCVRKVPFMWPVPSHPDVGQLVGSYFNAVAAAMAALCCSMVPPLSRIRNLLRLAIGHPDALRISNQTCGNICCRGKINCRVFTSDGIEICQLNDLIRRNQVSGIWKNFQSFDSRNGKNVALEMWQ